MLDPLLIYDPLKQGLKRDEDDLTDDDVNFLSMIH